jgi:hypothetical protein
MPVCWQQAAPAAFQLPVPASVPCLAALCSGSALRIWPRIHLHRQFRRQLQRQPGQQRLGARGAAGELPARATPRSTTLAGPVSRQLLDNTLAATHPSG